jgi:cytochrome c oxidase subunit 2
VFAVFTLVVLFTVVSSVGSGSGPAGTGTSGNNKLSALVVCAAAVICMAIFAFGVRANVRMQVPPTQSIEIGVTADKGAWAFSYSQGAVTDQLVLPLNQPVRLLMSSADVMHSFYVPAFRIREAVIPNRYTTAWFTPVKTGNFPLFDMDCSSAEHAVKAATVSIVDYDKFDDWILRKSDPSIGKTPEEYGEYLYVKQGCNACHSVDGSVLIASSFMGMFGIVRQLESGDSVIADEEYIRKSILEPNADISKGFTPSMVAYPLKEKDLNAITAYIRSMKGSTEQQEEQ